MVVEAQKGMEDNLHMQTGMMVAELLVQLLVARLCPLYRRADLDVGRY